MKTFRLASPISSFSRLWQQLLVTIHHCAELQVWQKTDRQGNQYWQGYDPHHDKFVSFSSEDETRLWIEQQYYR